MKSNLKVTEYHYEVRTSRIPTVIDNIIKEWIGHGYINKIEGWVPEWGREKDCFLSLHLILAEVLS